MSVLCAVFSVCGFPLAIVEAARRASVGGRCRRPARGRLGVSCQKRKCSPCGRRFGPLDERTPLADEPSARPAEAELFVYLPRLERILGDLRRTGPESNRPRDRWRFSAYRMWMGLKP